MMTNPFYIAKLLVKKFRQELSEEEKDSLRLWASKQSKNEQLLDEIEHNTFDYSDGHIFKNLDEDQAWTKVLSKRKVFPLAMFLRIAAVLIMTLSIGGYLWLNKRNDDSRFIRSAEAKHLNDIKPAVLGAKIILADGTEMKIDNNFEVADNGQISIAHQIIPVNEQELAWNSLIVPSANFIALTLADGTKVWVNANSELDFPVKFASNERHVRLKGEAYFEVAKDQKRPFYVEVDGSTIKVLGTQFNVSAYKAGRSSTTLVEGRVELNNLISKQVLSPGERADVRGEKMNVVAADISKDLAWKNNIFYFKGDNIVSITQQLKDWYDIEVVFDPEVSLTQTYTGEVNRNVSLAEVCKMLEYASNLDFKIEKNKLIILNQKRTMK